MNIQIYKVGGAVRDEFLGVKSDGYSSCMPEFIKSGQQPLSFPP
jgi:tRNA nucleotidyltransferase/poly(A) polymerase